VGLGRVGLILVLEVSRLARCSADWHRLFELYVLTGTLIADQDSIHAPSEFNDRLLLGFEGTMPEAELHLIRVRLDGAAQQGGPRRTAPSPTGRFCPRQAGAGPALAR
jgi:DNA invertase Pin-like site-specific DNA recombinase